MKFAFSFGQKVNSQDEDESWNIEDWNLSDD